MLKDKRRKKVSEKNRWKRNKRERSKENAFDNSSTTYRKSPVLSLAN